MDGVNLVEAHRGNYKASSILLYLINSPDLQHLKRKSFEICNAAQDYHCWSRNCRSLRSSGPEPSRPLGRGR